MQRVAIIGTGFMGTVHAEALRRLGIPVVGVLGETPEDGKKAAKEMFVEQVFQDLPSLLQSTAVTAVHICVPNHLHFEMTRAALLAGKHVMCEKPLAMNTTESAELLKIERNVKCVAGVNYNLRFYPWCADLAADREKLGTINYITGSYTQDWLFHPHDFNWRVLSSRGGPLRAVGDIGTHWFDLAQMLVGAPISSLCADLATVHPTRTRPKNQDLGSFKQNQTGVDQELVRVDTEDFANVMLRFSNGTRGLLTVSQVTAGRKNRLAFEICGQKASAAWDGENPNELWMGYRDAPNALRIKDPSQMNAVGRSLCSYPPGHAEGYPDTFKQCFDHFYRYIEKGDFSAPKSFANLAAGHLELQLCEAVLKSHQTRSWVEIEGI